MYRINPQFEIPEELELPDCMYHQKPVNPTIKVSRSRPASGSAGGVNINGILPLSSINENKIASLNSEPISKARSPGGKGKNKSKTSPSQSQSQSKTSELASASTSKTELVSQEKIKAIEERQLALIDKIVGLHQTISTIHEQECIALAAKSKSQVVLTPAASEGDIDSIANLHTGDFVDIVINADRSKPPYSILFFYKLLEKVYGGGSIVTREMTHSSASTPTSGSCRKYLNAFNKNVDGIDSNKKRIILTVIWKKLNNETELILSPCNATVIYGEENITRFLSRILPRGKFPKLNYDGLEWDTKVRVDSFLDYTHLRSLDALESHLHVLNDGGSSKNKIGTVSEFLTGGKEPTIADFFMYSKTAQTLLENEALLGKYPNIMKWLWACQQFGGLTVFEI